MNRECRNCGWGGPSWYFVLGWCVDCWRASLKGAGAAFGAAVVGWLLKILLILPLLLIASTASADPKPYAVMLAGNVADLWTTKVALDTGRAHEGNPALSRQGIGTITIAKTCSVAVITLAMRVLETHGHPKVAKAIGYIDGGVTFGAAAHNLAVVRR